MTTVFADTYYFIALLNRADEGHQTAVKFTAKFTGEILTTTFVLAELGDGMSRFAIGKSSSRRCATCATTPMFALFIPTNLYFKRDAIYFRSGPTKSGRSPIACRL